MEKKEDKNKILLDINDYILPENQNNWKSIDIWKRKEQYQNENKL